MVHDDMYFTYKAVVMNFSNPCRIPSASLSMLLYHQPIYWQMQWVETLHCLVPHHIHNSGCPLPAAVKCPGLLLMHQFPGIMAFQHHSISCMCLLLPVTCLFCMFCDMIYSKSKQHWLMSALWVVCILPQSLVRTYSGSLLYPGMTTVLFLFW